MPKIFDTRSRRSFRLRAVNRTCRAPSRRLPLGQVLKEGDEVSSKYEGGRPVLPCLEFTAPDRPEERGATKPRDTRKISNPVRDNVRWFQRVQHRVLGARKVFGRPGPSTVSLRWGLRCLPLTVSNPARSRGGRPVFNIVGGRAASSRAGG